MISVIIPVLNEAQSVAAVVNMARVHPLVDEVIVVDDKSVDDTVSAARKAGATVITSTKLGKGASMRDGFLAAHNDVLLYLDGDIAEYSGTVIDKLSSPLLADQADLVKATFSRQAGRVTELVAKPLLGILFPRLPAFSQPLSGMICVRRELLRRVHFEDDYGVDIGLLLDIHDLGARVVEVNIGSIENRMRPWQQLGKMSREVARAILRRASRSPELSLDDLETINVVRTQMEHALRESVRQLQKMVIFDMDDTILRGRFAFAAAEHFGFHRQLMDLMSRDQEPFVRVKQIAQLFKGAPISALWKVVDALPLVSDIIDVVASLHKRGYIVGIISDSYDCIVDHVKVKIGADFALAHELEFSQSVATGEVRVPSFFTRTAASRCAHTICKGNVMRAVAEQYGIELKNVIAVGDSEGDLCMVRAAGIGVAFCSKNDLLRAVADQCIDEELMAPILGFAH